MIEAYYPRFMLESKVSCSSNHVIISSQGFWPRVHFTLTRLLVQHENLLKFICLCLSQALWMWSVPCLWDGGGKLFCTNAKHTSVFTCKIILELHFRELTFPETVRKKKPKQCWNWEIITDNINRHSIIHDVLFRQRDVDYTRGYIFSSLLLPNHRWVHN